LNDAAVANGGKLTVKDAATAAARIALTGGIAGNPAVQALLKILKAAGHIIKEEAQIDEAFDLAEIDDAEFAEATAGELIAKVKAFLTHVGQASIVLPATLTTIVTAVTSVPGLSTALGALLTAAGAGPAGAPIAHYTIAVIKALNSAAVASGGKLTVKAAATAIAGVALTGGVGNLPAVRALVAAYKLVH